MLTASSLYILSLMFNGDEKPNHICLILFFKKVLKGGTTHYNNAKSSVGSLPEPTCFLHQMRGAGRTFLVCWHPPRHLCPSPQDLRAEHRIARNTWENTMTLPVSSFTVWMVPCTTAVPTAFPVTCPRLVTAATVWLLLEKWMTDCG